MAVVRFPPVRGLIEAVVCLSVSLTGGPVESADCNGNCIDDAEEVALQDCNANGIPDDCDLKPPGADFDRSPVFLPGGVPISLDVVDLDLDGFADVLTGDALRSGPGTGVSIYFNDGGGGLEAPTSIVIPESVPGTLLHADLDSDGDPDIAIASVVSEACRLGLNRVSIIENRGRREFAHTVLFEAGRSVLDLAAADIDRDGDLDLVTVDAGTVDTLGGAVTVLRNRGDASFDPPEQGSSAPGPAISIAAADLEGDGDIDLAATHGGLGYVTLFPNVGNGTFGPSGAVLAMSRLGNVLAEDLDSDGDPDLFVSERGAEVGAVLENLGSGGAWRRTFHQGAGEACTADMDRDGLPDLVAPLAGNLQVFRNRGLLVFAAGDGVYSRHSVRDVASEDMDADGDHDIIALSDIFGLDGPRREWISVVCNQGGRLDGPRFIDGAGVPLGAADLDGDGDVDLVSQGFILRNSGSGDFLPENWILHTLGDNTTTSLALGDVDGDADLDLVTGYFTVGIGGPRLLVHPNNGAADLSTPIELFSDVGSFFDAARVSIADIDGDRDLDIAAVVNPSQVSLFINEGGGTFLAGEKAVTGSDPLVLTTGDLDGDGFSDVMTGNREVLGTSNVSVFRSRGDGSLLGARNYALRSEITWMALGDIDADGDLDAASNGVHILSNDGHGAFGSHRVHDAETASGILLDLDGDGDLDVAAGNQTLLLNDGKGSFDPQERPPSTEGKHLLGADLDGDSDLDLVEQGISITWNLGAASFQAPWMTEVPSDTKLTGIVDRDGDGDLDFTMASGPFTGFLDGAPGGRFETARWRLVAPGDRITALAFVDLDRKSGLDMVFITAAPRGRDRLRFSLVALLDGIDPALRQEVLDLGLPSTWPIFDLETGDVDADGDMDLALLRSACDPECGSTVFLIWNDGDGKLSTSPMPAGSQLMERLAPVDIDGDGDLDVITDSVLYRNGGAGAFDGPSPLPDACCGLAIADVDGDGDSDIVTGLTVLRNAGDGSSFESRSHRRPLENDLALRDLDGDGFPDLVGASRRVSGLNLLVNDRTGAFDAAVWLGSPGLVRFLEDLDADGRPDIVSSEPEGGFRVHWNRVAGRIVLGEHTDLDLDGRIDGCYGKPFTRGDVTSDRKIDISDAIALLRSIFGGDQELGCLEAADVDDDSSINLTDPILILVYLFQGGVPPAYPGPDDPCSPPLGTDSFDCNAYPAC